MRRLNLKFTTAAALLALGSFSFAGDFTAGDDILDLSFDANDEHVEAPPGT